MTCVLRLEGHQPQELVNLALSSFIRVLVRPEGSSASTHGFDIEDAEALTMIEEMKHGNREAWRVGAKLIS